MKKLSEHELVDLVALNRILKVSDDVIIGVDDGYYYISERHMVMRLRISYNNMTALSSTIKSRFNGELPRTGTALRSTRVGSNTEPFPLDSIEKLFDAEPDIPADDTSIMYQMPTGHIVRALYVDDGSRQSYIFLGMTFLECINSDSAIHAMKAERTSPVLFARGDEAALVLPVNMHTPAFMADISGWEHDD